MGVEWVGMLVEMWKKEKSGNEIMDGWVEWVGG